jgi:hypothetical protein
MGLGMAVWIVFSRFVSLCVQLPCSRRPASSVIAHPSRKPGAPWHLDNEATEMTFGPSATAAADRRVNSVRPRRGAARKTQGARLGNPRNASQATAFGRDVQRADVDRFAADVWPIIEAIRATGVSSLGAIADALNARGVRTSRGGRWQVSTV